MQAEGGGFETRVLHPRVKCYWPHESLPSSKTGFESRRPHTPSWSSGLRRLPVTQEIAGSNPVFGARYNARRALGRSGLRERAEGPSLARGSGSVGALPLPSTPLLRLASQTLKAGGS